MISLMLFVISAIIYYFVTWLIRVCKGLAGMKHERYHIVRGIMYDNDETNSEFLKTLSKKDVRYVNAMFVLFICCQWNAINILSAIIFLDYLLKYIQTTLIFHNIQYEHFIGLPLFILMWISIMICQAEQYYIFTTICLGCIASYVDFSYF